MSWFELELIVVYSLTDMVLFILVAVQAKALIGDIAIAPKRIDSSDMLVEAADSKSIMCSSWKAAGSFESRDLTL